MSITPLTFILGGMYLYIFYKYKRISDIVEKILVLLVAISLFVQSGYAISFNTMSVGFGILFSALSAFMFLFLILRSRKISKYEMYCWLLILTITISLIFLQIFKYKVVRYDGNIMPWDTYKNYISSIKKLGINKVNILTYFKMVFYCIISIVVYKYLNYENWINIILTFRKVAKAVIVYGIIEVILTCIFHISLYSCFTQYIIGRSEATMVESYNTQRGVLFQLQGLTREPSHYAIQLLFILIILYAANCIDRDKNYRVWIILILSLMGLSMAFTALLSIAIFGVINYMKMTQGKNNNNKVILYGIGCMFIVGIIYFVSTIYNLDSNDNFYAMRIKMTIDVIVNLIRNNSVDPTVFMTSPGCRLASSIGTIRLIGKSALFGLGPGTTISHTLTSYTLANYGVLGCFLWGKVTFCSGFYNYIIVNKKYKVIIMILIIAFLFASGIEINSICYLVIANCLVVIFGERKHEKNNI